MPIDPGGNTNNHCKMSMFFYASLDHSFGTQVPPPAHSNSWRLHLSPKPLLLLLAVTSPVTIRAAAVSIDPPLPPSRSVLRCCVHRSRLARFVVVDVIAVVIGVCLPFLHRASLPASVHSSGCGPACIAPQPTTGWCHTAKAGAGSKALQWFRASLTCA